MSWSREQIDNQWIVPYNPVLLLKYQCHLNVEYCASIKGVKYLYKYVFKGPTKVEVRTCLSFRRQVAVFRVAGEW